MVSELHTNTHMHAPTCTHAHTHTHTYNYAHKTLQVSCTRMHVCVCVDVCVCTPYSNVYNKNKAFRVKETPFNQHPQNFMVCTFIIFFKTSNFNDALTLANDPKTAIFNTCLYMDVLAMLNPRLQKLLNLVYCWLKVIIYYKHTAVELFTLRQLIRINSLSQVIFPVAIKDLAIPCM